MTQWTEIARAIDPPVPDEAAQAVKLGLERLEAALEPFVDALPIDTLPWDGNVA